MSCKDCKALRRALDIAQSDFTKFAKPYYERYPSLSFSEVQKFEALCEPYVKAVSRSRASLTRHEGKCAS